ncbi:phosphatase PAP2 family protein [Starkeya sp. ORNL1]|uniref:phosphatase PAP2 family protein n=1 Tax=Starkeya sp. ORNL1 TaxID=2709380 RepID=UPI00146449FB|nr:phosphatase PAP2 family protein [Starkeya sp. ORNL1]QJP17027.1 phosphatase PAP2 family protein [Starkeya sp. ORNL1]
MVRPARWLPASITAESGTLVTLLGAASALFAFALIAEDVLEGETHGFDERLLRAFRNPNDLADPIGPPWFEIMMRDITSLGSTTVLTIVTLAAVFYLVMDGKRASAALVAIAVSGGALLTYVLKFGFDRPRPDLVAHLVEVSTLSFPSGHAMGSAVTYLTLGALLARTQPRRRIKIYVLTVAVLLTLMVGVSRVYLGVHWPTDVLAGWCAGSAWALICWTVALWLQRHGDIEPTPSEEVTPPA